MTRISSILVLATAMAFLSNGPPSSSAAVLPARDMASQDRQDATITDLSNILVTRAVDAKTSSDIQNKRHASCPYGTYWSAWDNHCAAWFWVDGYGGRGGGLHQRDEVTAERDGQEIEELVARHDSYGGYDGDGHDDGGNRHDEHHHHGHYHYRGDTIDVRDAERGGRFTDEVVAADRGGGGGRGGRYTNEIDAADRGGGGGRGGGRRSMDEVDAADRGGRGRFTDEVDATDRGGRGRFTDEVDAADRGGGGGRGGGGRRRSINQIKARDTDRGRGGGGRRLVGGCRGGGSGRNSDTVDAEDEE